MNLESFITKYQGINFMNFGKISINPLNGSKKSFLRLYCGFDIETTKVGINTYPYHYQFSFGYDDIIDYVSFRTVDDFEKLMNFLVKKTSFPKKHTQCKLLIFIHNMSYEMAFLRKYINITKLFAKDKHKPMYIECRNVIFLDSYLIENKSLYNLSKDYKLDNIKYKNDLDYDVIRNSKTPLNYKEQRYCMNDVLILSEYSKKIYFNNYLENNFMPVTNTQKVRQSMLEFIVNNGGNIKKIRSTVSQLFPKTKDEYLIYFRYLFRGGFTHSNIIYTDKIIKDVQGYDFTSSYPYVMFSKYYPMSVFKDIDLENVSRETLNEYLNKYCCIMLVEFSNICNKATHSIDSFSKAIEIEDYMLDNGRIKSASRLKVMLTELDYESYCEFYEWDEMEILSFKIAKRGKLPEYVIKPMLYYYKLKNELKGIKDKEVLYMRSKNMLNSFYGCMVTRLVFQDTILNEEGNYIKVASDKDYQEMTKNLLSPFWGIWVTAHARRNELFLLHRLKGVIYSDTDSHKCLNVFKKFNEKIIEEYNKNVYNEIIENCEFYNINDEYKNVLLSTNNKYNLYSCNQKTIGYACNDGHYIAFKTLGCKRYIYLDDSFKRHVTVAGLPKGIYEKENYSIVDFFNNFKSGYIAKNCKLRSIYNDNFICDTVTDNYGNTEVMEIESCVTLEKTDFTLNVDPDYFELIKDESVKYLLMKGRL